MSQLHARLLSNISASYTANSISPLLTFGTKCVTQLSCTYSTIAVLYVTHTMFLVCLSLKVCKSLLAGSLPRIGSLSTLNWSPVPHKESCKNSRYHSQLLYGTLPALSPSAS